MKRNWDYANLAKIAKRYGGPEKYLNTIKEASFSKGYGQAKTEDFRIQLILTAAGLVASGIAVYDGWRVRKLTQQIKDTEAAEAEQILLEELEEMEKAQCQTEASNDQ